MSADHDDSESEVPEKKSYNFLGRFIIFLLIAGPASVFGVGLYGRVGIQNALSAAQRGDYSHSAIFLIWFGGLIGTAVMVFKR